MFRVKCPYCKEKINRDASICKHCKSSINKYVKSNKTKSLLANKYTWIFIFLLFVVGIYGEIKKIDDEVNGFNIKVNNKELIIISENKDNVNDKSLFKKNGYAGDFKGCEINKKSGKTKLVIWGPFGDSMQGLAAKFGRIAPIYDRILVVEYDEIWTTNKTGTKNSDGDLDINKLYFYKNKLMASTSSRIYDYDPVTKQTLPEKDYKIITALTRDEIIDGIKSLK